MIHIFQAPCGSGKSEIMRRLIEKHSDKSFLMLFKNHDNEEKWKLGQAYPQIRNLPIYSDIEEMYKLGLNPGQMVHMFIQNNLNNDSSVQAYVQELEAFHNARVKKGCIERFFISDDFSEIDTDIVVFDESIIEHAVKIGNITVKDLETIKESDIISSQNWNHFKKTLRHNKRFPLSLIKDMRKNIKRNFKTALSISQSIKSLNELLNSDDYEGNIDSSKNPRIIYMQNRLSRLDAIVNDPQKKVFILSATPEMTLYDARFTTCLHQLPEAEMKSEITFYIPSKTIAKGPLCSMSHEEIIDMLKAAQVEHVKNIMSFKEFVPAPGYNLANWWGRECGSNDFIGQDTTVIGTFKYPEYVITFLAKAAGLEFDESKAQWKNQTVTIEGHSVTGRFMEDETLRKLEIEMCQNKIIQMMHRPRPITEDVTCTVISNIPLPGIPVHLL